MPLVSLNIYDESAAPAVCDSVHMVSPSTPVQWESYSVQPVGAVSVKQVPPGLCPKIIATSVFPLAGDGERAMEMELPEVPFCAVYTCSWLGDAGATRMMFDSPYAGAVEYAADAAVAAREERFAWPVVSEMAESACASLE